MIDTNRGGFGCTCAGFDLFSTGGGVDSVDFLGPLWKEGASDRIQSSC